MIDDAQFDRIIAALQTGLSIRAALKAEGLNARLFYAHLAADPDDAKQYGRARSVGLDALAVEAIEISDDVATVLFDINGNPIMRTNAAGELVPIFGALTPETINHAKLRVETRKWFLARLAPRKYGERTTIAGDADAPLFTVDAAAAVLGKLIPEASAIGATGTAGDAEQG